MNATTCPCTDPTCPRCGGAPVVVFSEDAPRSNRPPPRTDPPRHAENAAFALYQRVAGRPQRIRPRFRVRSIALGAGLLAMAGTVFYFDWDVAILRLGSIALAGFGTINLLKGLMGYGR